MVPSSTKKTKPSPTSHRPYLPSRPDASRPLISPCPALSRAATLSSPLISPLRGRRGITPGIQPQSIALAQEDRHEQRQHEQITDEDLQRRFGQSQVPKAAAVRNRN